jgi:DNA polymerase III subunit beta
MRFKTNKKELLKSLQRVVSATTTKSTLPILSNILVEADKTTVRWVGTDLEMGVLTEMGAEVLERGSVTIPGKRLYDIVRELPEAEVEIALHKNNIISIKCEKALFKMTCLPKDDFPKLPELKTQDMLSIPQSLLKEMLGITSFAASIDETRYVLNGVLLIARHKELKLVATDGRRLSIIKRKGVVPQGVNREVILPSKAVRELERNLEGDEPLKMWFGETQVRFDIGHTQLYSRLIEGQFPNYEQVIPKEKGREIQLRREDFLLAVKRMSLVAGNSQPVRIEMGTNRLLTSVASSEVGEAREEISGRYTGETVTVGFNPHYLMDALKNIDLEEVTLELADSDKPGVLRTGDDYLYVVMPMQLS